MGSLGTPVPIAANASATSTALTTGSSSGSSTYTGNLLAAILVGTSPPTSNPTVTWEYSFDGTLYAPDDRYGTIVVPITTASATYYYSYQPMVGAISARVLIAGGATNAISAYAQGVTLGVS